MLIDVALEMDDVDSAADQARVAERDGYAGFVVSETKHDPFFPLVQAAATTEKIELATAIAIAFARTPMTLANIGYDLQRISRGRFVLGLGSQIKPHVEKRYSMPWGKPASRMREMLQALNAIWSAWENGTKLDFRSEYYTHTLMTPMFTPPRHEYGAPRVRLAAVGGSMTRVAGELADGVICHPFTSPDYLRAVTLPALAEGAARGNRDLSSFECTGMMMIGLAETDEEYAKSAAALRKQIAFYASTPSYVGVLEAHDWGDLQPALNALSKEGKWDEMGDLITEEMLHTFAALGTPTEVATAVNDRYGDLITRASVYTPHPPAAGLMTEFVAHNNTLIPA
ncbi:TIGR03617 family F420-dependent LLM class oxidoreductase [Nocardioides alcanivorans]|uniref:TIGR03617 family F420-dependent LLM class oxidoreductase n=1 Tax=Nocardioides alcanivorans TaxID=2897352 RepID=UPI001F34C8C1|nr:TIGR03617 family F420-dependent LLM class oxidoreductase [Nocardioides alcanivorans]